MYLRYFGFQDRPFSITPDPAFLYMSAYHREALGHLLYGTGEHGGFVQLTGEVGTGKTTLIRSLVEQDIENLDIALCLNPRLTVKEFVATICDELGVAYPRGEEATLKNLVDTLNAHLLETHAQGRRTVLIIDEAQNLSREVLEELRLLTNLETRKHKLLRIILVGQPELEELLERPDLRQLSQRITARYHLRPLSRAETMRYIRHRLEVVGGSTDIFTKAAYAAIYSETGGIPRLINTVCERALMGAYSQGQRRISAAIVRRAADETLARRPSAMGDSLREALVPVAVLVGAAGLAFGLHYGLDPLLQQNQQIAGTSVAQAASESAQETNAEAGQDEQSETSGTETEPAQTTSADAVPTPPEQLQLPRGDASMSQLLRLWGVFGAEVNSSCDGLSIGALRCLNDRGSFADLERYDRPALLTLEANGSRRRILLSGLTEDAATLVGPDGAQEWPRQALARMWTGEYRMVWRLQSPVRRLREGSVGNGVVWLRKRLAMAEGVNLDLQAGEPSPVFDEGLGAKLRQFQITNGLKPDGVVGARTMILLNSISPAPGTPFLRPREKV